MSVCAVVCVSLDVSVSHTGGSNGLWRFSTSTRGWEQVDTPATTRMLSDHTMTSVGLDLWVHGGIKEKNSGDGDTCTTRAVLLLPLHRGRECVSFLLETKSTAGASVLQYLCVLGLLTFVCLCRVIR